LESSRACWIGYFNEGISTVLPYALVWLWSLTLLTFLATLTASCFVRVIVKPLLAIPVVTNQAILCLKHKEAGYAFQAIEGTRSLALLATVAAINACLLEVAIVGLDRALLDTHTPFPV